MTTFAFIENGVVVNTALFDDLPEGWVELPAGFGRGDLHDGSSFSHPEPPGFDPVNYPLKRWQFRAMVAYLDKGDPIETAIGAMPDALQRAVAMARYKESDIYNYADPLFALLAPAVGLTMEQVAEAWEVIALG